MPGNIIMERLTVGDICVLGHGDVNRNGKETTTSWDTLSYALYMGHSVYNILQQFKKQTDLLIWKNTELQHIGKTGKR